MPKANRVESQQNDLIAGIWPVSSGVKVSELQEQRPPFIPDPANVMTWELEFPPGFPGTPPHRHCGPVFGYILEGEMLFELEGEPERVIRAGEVFWEPGGDVIHYQDRNNRQDMPCRFVIVMICAPGEPMMTLVGEDELARRRVAAPRRPT
jgi:quercetin dioxygenase-like cupin family protein